MLDRSQKGMTIIEVLVAVSLMLGGVGAMLGALGATKRTTGAAKRQALAVGIAQRELEKLNRIPYDQLALSSEASQATNSDETNDLTHGYWSLSSPEGLLSIRACAGAPGGCFGGSRVEETVVDVDSGSVAPSEVLPPVDGLQPQVWRYVTWRDDECTGPGKCLDHDTKRLLVAVRLPPNAAQPITKPVWLSAIATNHQGEVDPIGPPDTAPHGYKTVTEQRYYLHDAPCYDADPSNVVEHATANTSGYDPDARAPGEAADAAEQALCRNGSPQPAPGLLDPEAPKLPSSSVPQSTIPADNCNDVASIYPCQMLSGAVSSASECQAASNAFPYAWTYGSPGTGSSSSANRWNTRAWSTQALLDSLTLNRVTLSLHATSATGTEAFAAMCAYLVDRNEYPNGTSDPQLYVPEDELITSFPIDVTLGAAAGSTESGAYTHFNVSKDLAAQYMVPANHQLVLVLAVRSDSETNVGLGFGSPLVPSSLNLQVNSS